MERVEILFQDRRMVVCVKPAGVLSQKGKSGETSMVELLNEQLGTAIFPVHRLDRETGGVMVYARTAEAAADLSCQIQQGQMKKEYLAVVHGCPEADFGVLEDLLYHDTARNKSYVVKRKRRGVKQASLSYRVLAQQPEQTLIQVRLFTGRTHQIRVQFASRGMPLVGDGRYGGGGGRLALWSARLTWDLPNAVQHCVTCLPQGIGGFTELPPLAELK